MIDEKVYLGVSVELEDVKKLFKENKNDNCLDTDKDEDCFDEELSVEEEIDEIIDHLEEVLQLDVSYDDFDCLFYFGINVNDIKYETKSIKELKNMVINDMKNININIEYVDIDFFVVED